LPQTKTLGFRWNAFNNLFLSASDVGEAEHKASRSSDEENADTDSPNLERLRGYKADMAELDLLQKRGELVKVDALRMQLGMALTVLRESCGRLQREFGVRAYEIIEEAVGEAEQRIAMIGNDGSSDTGHSRNDVPSSAAVGAEHSAAEVADASSIR